MCLEADNHSARGLASTYQEASRVEPIQAPYQGPSEPRAAASSTRRWKSRQKGMKNAGRQGEKRHSPSPERQALCLRRGLEE